MKLVLVLLLIGHLCLTGALYRDENGEIGSEVAAEVDGSIPKRGEDDETGDTRTNNAVQLNNNQEAEQSRNGESNDGLKSWPEDNPPPAKKKSKRRKNKKRYNKLRRNKKSRRNKNRPWSKKLKNKLRRNKPKNNSGAYKLFKNRRRKGRRRG